jgi:hypothetical protein
LGCFSDGNNDVGLCVCVDYSGMRSCSWNEIKFSGRCAEMASDERTGPSMKETNRLQRLEEFVKKLFYVTLAPFIFARPITRSISSFSFLHSGEFYSQCFVCFVRCSLYFKKGRNWDFKVLLTGLRIRGYVSFCFVLEGGDKLLRLLMQ